MEIEKAYISTKYSNEKKKKTNLIPGLKLLLTIRIT